MRSTPVPVASATVTEPALPSDFAASSSVRARTSATVEMSGRRRLPRQLAQREPVAVGREERDLLALDLDADAREQRERVVAARGDRDLGDGVRELVAVDRAGGRRHRPGGRGSPRPASSGA